MGDRDPGTLMQELNEHVALFKEAQTQLSIESETVQTLLDELKGHGMYMQIQGITAPPPTEVLPEPGLKPVVNPMTMAEVPKGPNPMVMADIPLIVPGGTLSASENPRVVAPPVIPDPGLTEGPEMSDEEREVYIAQERARRGSTPDSRDEVAIQREAVLTPDQAAANQASWMSTSSSWSRAISEGMKSAEKDAEKNTVMPGGFL